MPRERDEDEIDVRRLVERAVRRAFTEVAGAIGGVRRTFRLVVRLSLEEEGGGSGHLDVLLRADDDPSLFVTPNVAAAWWRPVSFATANGTQVMSVVRRVQRAARAFEALGRGAPSGNPLRVSLSADDVELFLTKGAKALGRQGVIVQLPAELTAEGRARLRARLHVGADDDDKQHLPPWGIGAAATEPFRWELTIGDVEVSPEEFRAIASAKREIVRVRGRWIAVDHGELAEAARALGDLRPGAMPAAQAAGLAIAREVNVTKAVAATVVARGRVQRAAEVATSLEAPRDVAQPAAFNGVLRPYQRRGLAWLLHLEAAGLGGVLADDMGLGKTAEVIALLAKAEDATGPTLVVCPASVLPNWERELNTFAPGFAGRSSPWCDSCAPRRPTRAGRVQRACDGRADDVRDAALDAEGRGGSLVGPGRRGRGAEHQKPVGRAVASGACDRGAVPRGVDGHAGREPARRLVVDHAVHEPGLVWVEGDVPRAVRRAGRAR